MKAVHGRQQLIDARIRGAQPSPRRLKALLQQLETYQVQLTEQKRKLEQTREELQNSYTRYQELYEFAPVGFLGLDKQGRIRELNDKAAQLLSFSSSWLINRPFMVFVAKEHVRAFLAFLVGSIRQPKHQTIEIDLFVNGRRLPVQISMKTTDQNNTVLHRMTVVDLTDIRKIETQLQQSLNNWHSLVDNAPEVIMTLERTGRIVFVNRPIWGRPVHTLVGTKLTEYIHNVERPRLKQCLNDVFVTGKSTACEITGINNDMAAWFSFSFGPGRNDVNGLRAGKKTTTLMIREISEHKRTEETLRSSGEQLREFAARLESVREEERTRVAREIHDELGQALTVLKLDLSWLLGKTPRAQNQSRHKMKSMMLHVDETIERVRRIASELRPSLLDDLGLIPAIEWQLSEFQKRTGIRCRLRANADYQDFDRERSAAVFRVVQEALTNVMRHANASAVRVSLKTDGEVLQISVADNGRGITEGEITQLTSLGIVGMKERVSRFRGEFKIHSRRGQGTRIEITLPMEP